MWDMNNTTAPMNAVQNEDSIAAWLDYLAPIKERSAFTSGKLFKILLLHWGVVTAP